MEIVYSKNQHAWVLLAEIPYASGKMWTNEKKKMSDKEVRTACCKQRAPDVKDIQISAQNTPLFLPNHWRHKSMKEKTPKTKQPLHYKSTK